MPFMKRIFADFNVSYTGKSQYQANPIKPLSKKILEDDIDSRYFKIQGSYGPIYFDSNNRRYLRVFNHEMSESDYDAKQELKKEVCYNI